MEIIHYASATQYCAGGRNDAGRWPDVTCPDCLKSLGPMERMVRMAAAQGRDIHLSVAYDYTAELTITDRLEKSAPGAGYRFAVRSSFDEVLKSAIEWMKREATKEEMKQLEMFRG